MASSVQEKEEKRQWSVDLKGPTSRQRFKYRISALEPNFYSLYKGSIMGTYQPTQDLDWVLSLLFNPGSAQIL